MLQTNAAPIRAQRIKRERPTARGGMITGATIEALRYEEAELQARLPRPRLSDPEARAEAREIVNASLRSWSRKRDIALRAAAEAERRTNRTRRRRRRAA